MEKKRVVIALGGNALGKDIEEQKEAVAKTAESHRRSGAAGNGTCHHAWEMARRWG